MKVLSINLGTQKSLLYRGKTVKTGIFKAPVEGPQTVTLEGFIGDHQADLQHHGGADKAIYVYDQMNLAYWAHQRGESDYPPGHLGENLTVMGMGDEAVHLGDIFAIGTAEVQVTQPRVPCFKLGLRMGDPGFLKLFARASRPGAYLRILREGDVGAGDAVTVVHRPAHAVTMRLMSDALLKDHALLPRVLEAPELMPSWREWIEERVG